MWFSSPIFCLEWLPYFTDRDYKAGQDFPAGLKGCRLPAVEVRMRIFLLDKRVDRLPMANKGCSGDEQRATCFDAKTSKDGPRMTFELMLNQI